VDAAFQFKKKKLHRSRPEEKPIFNDGKYARHFPGQVVLFALQRPVRTQNDRRQRMTCTRVQIILNVTVFEFYLFLLSLFSHIKDRLGLRMMLVRKYPNFIDVDVSVVVGKEHIQEHGQHMLYTTVIVYISLGLG
jgi:hypothetical protein